MKKNLRRSDSNRVSSDVARLSGDLSGLEGNLSGLSGDVTNLRGNVTGLTFNTENQSMFYNVANHGASAATGSLNAAVDQIVRCAAVWKYFTNPTAIAFARKLRELSKFTH